MYRTCIYCFKEARQRSWHSWVYSGQRGITSIYRWGNETPRGNWPMPGPRATSLSFPFPVSPAAPGLGWHSLFLTLQLELYMNPWSFVHTRFCYWYSWGMIWVSPESWLKIKCSPHPVGESHWNVSVPRAEKEVHDFCYPHVHLTMSSPSRLPTVWHLNTKLPDFPLSSDLYSPNSTVTLCPISLYWYTSNP